MRQPANTSVQVTNGYLQLSTSGDTAEYPVVERAGIDGALVDDVIMGCATPEGATGGNIARQIAIRAGLPVTVSGVTVNRFCSSGLQTVALAAQRIIAGEADIFVAGGVESISMVQNEMNKHHYQDEWLHRHKPEIYWPMLQTARARPRSKQGRLDLALSPMEILPVPDRSFDVVVAHGIWNLARSGGEFRAAVQEAARAARPGANLAARRASMALS